ncbi:16S rRNA (cytidine(1402)-2'-O)-methyltransferase [Candidatus Nomurabacteria bacterium]|nr:16S rRNA (cytidine(1402)-2'-O)-methyltransferase [Candidatus Nomurabacteria bacterium]
MSKLYVVATPIGNLEDITLRAARVLKEADLILCEDTRVTKKLLDKFEIKNKLDSYHSQSKISKTDKILSLLSEGKDLALVSDAGTPTISDPGSQLIKIIREHMPEVEIVSVPGASALTAAMSISGITGGDFTFLGFLPHKKGRETLFKEMAESDRTFVFYESTHRLLKTIDSLIKFCPNKKVFIAKELTKMHEEMIIGSAEELKEYFKQYPDKVKGEFVVMVAEGREIILGLN